MFLKICSIVLILCHTIKTNMQIETSRKNVQSYIDDIQMKSSILSLYMPKTFQWKTKSIMNFFDLNLISLFHQILEKYKML